MDYFAPQMSAQDLSKISMLGLAHIGDGVYELLIHALHPGPRRRGRAAPPDG